MAKKHHIARIPGILWGVACTSLIIGLVFMLWGIAAIRQQEKQPILMHTGIFERYYTKSFAGYRSSTTVYCFVVDGETYYVANNVWRALDRDAAANLTPGTELTLGYIPDSLQRQIQADRQLVSIATADRTLMSREGFYREFRSNWIIAIVLGSVFVLMGMAIPLIFIFTERQLYRPSSHKRHH